MAARVLWLRRPGDVPDRRRPRGAPARLRGDADHPARGSSDWPADRENALAVLRRVVGLGVNLIDTSNAYGPEVSELQIAEALHPYPDGLVIATKGGLVRDDSASWPRDGRPEHLREACEASLRRLRLERIDVYQLHAPDPKVPIEESVGALPELRDEGKIRHVGLSNVSVDELRAGSERSCRSSPSRTSTTSASFATPRTCWRCERQGIVFLPWYPLEAGGLADAGGAVGRVADARSARPVQIALAWLLARSPVVVAIPGTGSISHLEENVAAAELRLSDAELVALG